MSDDQNYHLMIWANGNIVRYNNDALGRRDINLAGLLHLQNSNVKLHVLQSSDLFGAGARES